jgi:hypothetical protein
MKHQPIGDRDRVWTVTRGEDGELKAELDPNLLERLSEARSAKEVVAVLSDEIARTRDW